VRGRPDHPRARRGARGCRGGDPAGRRGGERGAVALRAGEALPHPLTRLLGRGGRDYPDAEAEAAGSRAAFRGRDRRALRVTAAFLVASAFLASAVEMVEALTIVLAAGVTRGWRSALAGVAAATVALAAIVAALGPA